MHHSAIPPTLMLLAGSLAFGQTSDKPLSFDAASVKPSQPVAGRAGATFGFANGGPGAKDPGRVHYPFMSLKNLLIRAYDVKAYQISGPTWIDTERFDVDATMPPDTTPVQFRSMLQNLLVERFQMTIHRETKELPLYALTVNKGGPKMKEATQPQSVDANATPPPPPPSQPKIGADGFPLLPPGMSGHPGIFNIMMPGRTKMYAQIQTPQDLAARLTDLLGRPVTDGTGLKGKYDFTLTFSLEGLNVAGPMGPMPASPPPNGGDPTTTFVPDGEAPPDLFTAVQAQLGLKLEAKKGPVDLIVIDHIEKTPTGN